MPPPPSPMGWPGALAVYPSRSLLELAQLVVEGSGAVGIVAALLAGRVNLAGRKAVMVLTGANIDADLLFEIMIEQLNHNNMEVGRQK